MTSVAFTVKGMSCSGCARSVERKLLATPGVQSAVVDLEAATATVTFDETATDRDALKKAVESLGFDVVGGEG